MECAIIDDDDSIDAAEDDAAAAGLPPVGCLMVRAGLIDIKQFYSRCRCLLVLMLRLTNSGAHRLHQAARRWRDDGEPSIEGFAWYCGVLDGYERELSEPESVVAWMRHADGSLQRLTADQAVAAARDLASMRAGVLPLEGSHQDWCHVCSAAMPGDSLLRCGSCERSAHRMCVALEPSGDGVSALPSWWCDDCAAEAADATAVEEAAVEPGGRGSPLWRMEPPDLVLGDLPPTSHQDVEDPGLEMPMPDVVPATVPAVVSALASSAEDDRHAQQKASSCWGREEVAELGGEFDSDGEEDSAWMSPAGTNAPPAASPTSVAAPLRAKGVLATLAATRPYLLAPPFLPAPQRPRPCPASPTAGCAQQAAAHESARRLAAEVARDSDQFRLRGIMSARRPELQSGRGRFLVSVVLSAFSGSASSGGCGATAAPLPARRGAEKPSTRCGDRPASRSQPAGRREEGGCDDLALGDQPVSPPSRVVWAADLEDRPRTASGGQSCSGAAGAGASPVTPPAERQPPKRKREEETVLGAPAVAAGGLPAACPVLPTAFAPETAA